MTSVALYVELKAKPGKEEEVAAFLAGAQSLAVSEAGTIVWFAARVDEDTFFIFDAFNEEAGRNRRGSHGQRRETPRDGASHSQSGYSGGQTACLI